jgi:hypothetical protein
MEDKPYGEEGRKCDWPGCLKTTDNPTEGGWTLGWIDEHYLKFLPKGFPWFYAACPLHKQMIEACCDTVDEESPE